MKFLRNISEITTYSFNPPSLLQNVLVLNLSFISKKNQALKPSHTLLPILLFLLATPLFAQWNISSQTTLNGNRDDQLVGLLQLNGNFIGLGKSDSDYENNQGLYDFWLAKWDENLNVSWQNSWGSPGEDIPKDFVSNGAGDLIVVGTTDSIGGNITSWQGNLDAWVIKVDKDGELLWQKSFGGSQNDVLESIIAVEDGFVLAGYSESPEILTDGQGEKDVWLVKIDEMGEMLWQKTLGSSEDDEGKDLLYLENGKMMLAAYIRTNDGDVTNHISSKDFWVTQLDQAGNIENQWTFGGNKADVPTVLVQVDNNHFAVAGETFSDFENSHGGGDTWVIQFDTSGTILQTNVIGGSSLDSPKDMIVNENQELILVGETFSINGDINTSYSTMNAFIGRINQANDDHNIQVFGGNQFDSAWGIIPLANDAYMIAGYTDSYDGDLAGKVAHGNHDAWIFVLDLFTDLPNISILPPFSLHEKMLHFHTQDIQQISLYDLQGKTILQQKNPTNFLDIGHLSTGIYIINLLIENKPFTAKIHLP